MIVSAVIAHTTDLSGDDGAAFVHACALAAAGGGRVVTIHGNPGAVDASRLPDAATLATRWGRPIDQARVCHACCDDVAETILDAVRDVAPTLIVTGTHARHGLAALFAGSVAEAVARNVAIPTLIVPNRGRGFADPERGALDLRTILVPAGSEAEAAAGLAAARAFAELAATPDAQIVPFHVDGGTIADRIVAAAAEREAHLIVMVTRGHDGIGDVLRGSLTERVIRDAGCPVLSVPIASR